jgi:hypothetical protein
MPAEFWQYDSRLGRRWNLDPVVKPWESGYAVFNDNPILKIDPNGDDAHEFDVNAETGEAIKVSDKGGNETQHFNIMDNSGNTLAEYSATGNNVSVDFSDQKGLSINVSGVTSDNTGEGEELTLPIEYIFSSAMVGVTKEAYKRGSPSAKYAKKIKGKMKNAKVVTKYQGISAQRTARNIGKLGKGLTVITLTVSAVNTFSGNASVGSFVYDVSMVGVAAIPYVGVPLSVLGSVYKNETMDYLEKGAGIKPNQDLHLCFVAGTPVSINDKLMFIEQLAINDSVISYNETTGMIELMKINLVGSKIASNIYEVITSSDTLMVTGEHPFFVTDKNWVKAMDLTPSDKLKSLINRDEKIISINKLELHKTVYNIEVATNHNYFVGTAKILVHNKTFQLQLIPTKVLNK